jgi:hypothetical protein
MIVHSWNLQEAPMVALGSLRWLAAALSLFALAACYHGPNLRDCSEWRTTSVAGCWDSPQ